MGIQFSKQNKNKKKLSLSCENKTEKVNKRRTLPIRKSDPKKQTNKRDCRQVKLVETKEEKYTKWFTVDEKSIFRRIIKRRIKKNRTEIKTKTKQTKI